MTTLSEFKTFASGLNVQEQLMPTLFIGHGSPMNGIEDTGFSRRWKQMAKEIPTPKAVVVVSAHWFTNGTHITAMDFPQTIHDFGGFPKELYGVQYPAPGNPALAKETAELLRSANVELDHDWGLDHGTWTVVRHMYPGANIPVLQLSIDYTKAPQYHYDLAKELQALRRKGVLIIGSGNMVHNLRMVAWDKLSGPEYAYDWATEINDKFKELIQAGDHKPLINYNSLGKGAMLAIPTPEHYLPLMYTLGLKDSSDHVSFFNDTAVGGVVNYDIRQIRIISYVYRTMKKAVLFLVFVLVLESPSFADPGPDAILGNWMSTRRNVTVQVYRDGSEFKGRVTWFKDSDDPGKPMNTRTDENNPDPKLRQRKVLGLQVLSRLQYNSKSKRWENGKIYDPKTGRQWSSVAYFDQEGVLNVKGYWQFEFIGKTMRFKKVG